MLIIENDITFILFLSCSTCWRFPNCTMVFNNSCACSFTCDDDDDCVFTSLGESVARTKRVEKEKKKKKKKWRLVHWIFTITIERERVGKRKKNRIRTRWITVLE